MPRKRTGAEPRLLVLPAVFAAAFLGALGGCSSNDADETSPPAASTTTVVTTTPGTATTATTTTAPGGGGTPARNENTNAGPGGATGTETALADAINKKIIRNPQMTGSRVTAVVDASGVAVLNGFTQNQQQKALAEKSARDTAGVSSVKNKLEIRPTGGTGKTAKTPTPPPPAPKTTVIVVPGAPAAPPPAAPAGTEPAPEPGNGGSPATDPPAPPAAPPAPTGGGQ